MTACPNASILMLKRTALIWLCQQTVGLCNNSLAKKLVLQMVGDVFSSLTAAVGAADKVVELMQQRPAIPAHGALQPADFAGRLELDSVAFSYPARPEVPVLNGLSLKVNPGEVCPCPLSCTSGPYGSKTSC